MREWIAEVTAALVVAIFVGWLFKASGAETMLLYLAQLALIKLFYIQQRIK